MTYLFDFDGTLVDSMPTYERSVVSILEEHGIAYPADLVKTITPLGVIETARYYIGLGLDMTVEQIVAWMKKTFMDAYLYRIPAKPYVAEVLKQLKDRGDDLYVLTASPHMSLDPCLKRLELYDLFTHVWSCDDFHTSKSDPELYRKVSEVIGRPVAKILFLDDNPQACHTAKTAGMKVCGVYDASSQAYREEMKTQNDFYIEDFSQLPGLTF